MGLGAGALGAFTIAIISLVVLPFCVAGARATSIEEGKLWSWQRKGFWIVAVTLWGTFGSILDSVLGGLLQATVVDKRTGKVVEGSGGRKVSKRHAIFCLSTQAAPH